MLLQIAQFFKQQLHSFTQIDSSHYPMHKSIKYYHFTGSKI